MNCPYCGGEMIKGKVTTSGYKLIFATKKHPIILRAGENEVNLSENFLNFASIDAYNCTKCEKIEIDYSHLLRRR